MSTIDPHGGTLVQLLADGSDVDALREEARNLPKLVVSERELSDLEMLAVGALSPLTGFQGEADYHSVLETMHLESGLPWSIPVTLSVDEDGAHRLGGADAVALVASEGSEPLAVLRITEIFKRDRSKEATVRLRDRGPRASGGEGAPRCRRPLRRRHARGDRAAAARRLRAVPTDAGRDARGVRPSRVANGGGLPDEEPDPSSPRVHPEVRARDRGRPAGAPPGGRDEGRRRPARRADALLRGAVRGLLPEGPGDGLRLPGGDALRGSEGGDLARDLPEELRLHPLHRGTRSRRRRQTTTGPTTRRRSSSGSSRASWGSRR